MKFRQLGVLGIRVIVTWGPKTLVFQVNYALLISYRAGVPEGTVRLVPADSVIEISTNTRPVQTRAWGEQFLTRWVTTLQRTGVVKDNNG